MLPLYPEIKPYQRHRLPVDPPHELYLEESGSPDGIPVVYLHGGPGAGCDGRSRCYFDPERYRIVAFDQRGAGRSTPHAELTRNTTQDLVEDLEAIRNHLGIEQWVLFGGSWGSTLALVYAQTYPERVSGMILRGVFLARDEDLQWFYQGGAGRVFPDYWEQFVAPIALIERNDMIGAYYRLLTGGNELARMAAAKAWSLWEAHCATLRPNSHLVERFSDPHRALALACIEAHYFVNKAFLAPQQILDNADKLADIPGVIVHGRYDMICPLDNATALHDHWPASELHIIRDAGHAATEPSIIDALVRATRDMAKTLKGEG